MIKEIFKVYILKKFISNEIGCLCSGDLVVINSSVYRNKKDIKPRVSLVVQDVLVVGDHRHRSLHTLIDELFVPFKSFLMCSSE